MKSHLAAVLTVIEGVLDDASARWPTSTRSIELDRSYLRRAAEQRGLGFFTLTLPAFGKLIDRSLSEGSFLALEVPQGIPLIKKRPELFGDLYMKVFDKCGTLREDCDTEAVFFLRQLCYLGKKLRLECQPRYVKETLDEFFRVEACLPVPHPNTWYSDEPQWSDRTGHPLWGPGPGNSSDQEDLPGLPDHHRPPLPWHTLRTLVRRVVSGLGTPDWWNLSPKHGPGVVSETSGWTSKYEFPHWPTKLGLWFPYDWHGSGNLNDSESYPSDREPPSRLIAVPKTQKGPRLICAEPVAHQWMQQALWVWLRDRVGSTILGRSIRFGDQEVSRKRALDASIDGSLCTIDLSSASDRLSCRLVEYVFQGSEILDGLHACRTRLLSQTISPDHPRVIGMRKFAPMGSAVTFPVQSIVFTLLAVWALRLSEGREDSWSDLEYDFQRVTVFGDDIIAPTPAYEVIALVLHECGLKVNDTKSFRNGLFRESCGMDAFKGVDVTPAYLLESYDGSATSMAATVECSNNLHKRQCWNAAQRVANFLPPKEFRLLQVIGGEVSGLGLFSFCGSRSDHLRRCWNKNYQREEYLALGISSEVTKTKGTGQSSLTQYFTEEPDPDLPWSSGQVGRVRVRKARTRVTS